MNLLDCSVTYFTSVPAILSLRPKALSTALHIHNGGDESSVPERMKYQLAELVGNVRTDDHAFLLPAKLDYEKLSYAGQKTIIACYQQSKHSRTPFRITCTREHLADAAHLSLPHLRKALKELEAKRLLQVRQLWRKGIQLSLLDPEYDSGTPLYWIATFNRDRLETVPPLSWYKLLLHDQNISGDAENLSLDCCFCGTRNKLRVNTVDDKWYCHSCKRGGDHKRLWGLLHFFIDRHDWREALMRRELGL